MRSMLSSLKITTALIRRSRPDFRFASFEDTPVTPLSKPLSECKLALITTGGLYLRSDKPFDLKNSDGDCSYRILPADLKPEDISISHKWYNHKFINSDRNCVFPIDRMREYLKKGIIGSLSEEYYSFMGHIYLTDPLHKNSLKLGDRLRETGVDIAFLTPT